MSKSFSLKISVVENSEYQSKLTNDAGSSHSSFLPLDCGYDRERRCVWQVALPLVLAFHCADRSRCSTSTSRVPSPPTKRASILPTAHVRVVVRTLWNIGLVDVWAA